MRTHARGFFVPYGCQKRKRRLAGASRLFQHYELQNLELMHFVGLAVDDVNGAGNARVKGVNGTQDFHRALGIGNGRTHKSMLGGAHDVLRIPGTEVPRGRHDELEVGKSSDRRCRSSETDRRGER